MSISFGKQYCLIDNERIITTPQKIKKTYSAILTFNSKDPNDNGNNKPSDSTLIEKVVQKLKTKTPGIIASFPIELIGSSFMNKAFQQHESVVTKGQKLSLFKEVQNQFKSNPLGLLSATFIEHAVHRSMKVVVSEISASEFNATKVGHVGSVVIPSLAIFLAELTIAPLHLLMIKVQSSKPVLSMSKLSKDESNIFKAAHSVFKQGGVSGFWKGSETFAAKGFSFTAGQILGWRCIEAYTQKPISKMSLPEHISAVSTGALFGTITSAVPTKLYRDASMQQKSVVSLLKNSLNSGELISYLRTSFNLKAISSKAITKMPAHILQYTLFYAHFKELMLGEKK